MTITNSDILKKYNNLELISVKGDKIKIKEKTNIKCWHCTYNFDSVPCFIPDKFINGIFHVFGCFCSFNCALTYNLNFLNDSRVNTRHSLILLMFHKIFGKNKVLTYAPKKELLTDYGGPLTITKFRNSFLEINNEYRMNLPPVIPLIYEIEVRNREGIKTVVES